MGNDAIQEVIFTEEQIRERVRELGKTITRDYAGKSPVFIGVLKGCFVFMADLVRQVDLPLSLDFMVVSSYGNDTTSTGAVKIIKDRSFDIQDRDVLIVEDILDSGYTLSYLKRYLECRGPASVKIVTLLDKNARRKTDIQADYVGFSCPDDFIVGYGLDYREVFRNLPYIGSIS